MTLAQPAATREDPEVEVVLALYEAFARGDIAAATADLDAEVEWAPPISAPDGGRRVGAAAVGAYLEASRGAWKHLTSVPAAHRVGPEIVVLHRLQGILLDGTPHQAELAEVFRFREGRIGRMRAYEAPEEAFAAAPLRRWIDAYAAAWESRDPDAIAALFTVDGVYRSEPWQAWIGREQIVAGWRERAKARGGAAFHWWHLARDGDLWVVEARSRHRKRRREHAALWLVELDGEGPARGFSAWTKQVPEGFRSR